MLLSFKETISGKPTYVIEQIWLSLIRLPKTATGRIEVIGDFERYADRYFQQFGRHWDGCICSPHPDIQIQTVLAPKLHTIRAGRRWAPGDTLHFCVNPRSKSYFQFAPVRLVVSVQEIYIKWFSRYGDWKGDTLTFIDGEAVRADVIAQLAKNDGFPSVEAFFEWFSEDFSGQIIHWTPLRY